MPQVRQLRDRVETTTAASAKAAAAAQEEKAHAATLHTELREEIERKREEVAAARRAHEAAAAGSSESARAELQSLREAATEAARQADAQLEARSRELRDCQSRADTLEQLAETRATECADLRRRLAALEATNSTGLAAATSAPASAIGVGLPPADPQVAVRPLSMPAREQLSEQESHLDAALQRARQAEDRAADAEAALERAQHTATTTAARGASDDARNAGAPPGGPVGGGKTGPGVAHAAAIAAGRRYWDRKLEVEPCACRHTRRNAERSPFPIPLPKAERRAVEQAHNTLRHQKQWVRKKQHQLEDARERWRTARTNAATRGPTSENDARVTSSLLKEAKRELDTQVHTALAPPTRTAWHDVLCSAQAQGLNELVSQMRSAQNWLASRGGKLDKLESAIRRLDQHSGGRRRHGGHDMVSPSSVDSPSPSTGGGFATDDSVISFVDDIERISGGESV